MIKKKKVCIYIYISSAKRQIWLIRSHFQTVIHSGVIQLEFYPILIQTVIQLGLPTDTHFRLWFSLDSLPILISDYGSPWTPHRYSFQIVVHLGLPTDTHFRLWFTLDSIRYSFRMLFTLDSDIPSDRYSPWILSDTHSDCDSPTLSRGLTHSCFTAHHQNLTSVENGPMEGSNATSLRH